jgi:predicted Fe-S protein YdhL (DUF1289 family)
VARLRIDLPQATSFRDIAELETKKRGRNEQETAGSALVRTARVRKIATPAWKASECVSRQVTCRGCMADERKIREWKFILDYTHVVYRTNLSQRLRYRLRKFTGLSVRSRS